MFQNKFNQLVEIVVASGSTQQKIQFVDQPYLRSKMITGLSVYSAHDVPTSPQGNPVATAAQINSAFLTLYTTNPDKPTEQGQWIQQIPLWEFHTLQNTSNDPFSREPFYMAGQTIIWEKSYLELAAPLGAGTPISFLLHVRFLFQDVVTN